MKIKVGNKEFKVTVADDDESRAIGLSNTESLPKGEGLVLNFNEPVDVPITMENMKYPLDVIFSNGGKISKITSVNPGDKDIKSNTPSDLVLEVNLNAADGIKIGDAIVFVGEKNEDGTVQMAEGGLEVKGERQVLDEDGKNQMNLEGGERIFSRKATNKIFELAKSKEHLKLGRFIVKELHKQDTQKPEYSKN